MLKCKKMLFLFILLPWLSNELLWSINKLKQGLLCTIALFDYHYLTLYMYMYHTVLFCIVKISFGNQSNIPFWLTQSCNKVILILNRLLVKVNRK